MSNIKIQLVEDEEETPTVFERMWDYLMTFLKCVGIFFVICFCLGYFVSKQSQTVQCQPTKTVLAKGIFK
jgi:hypothetical protein